MPPVGHHRVPQPEKDQHMQNFNLALKDALSQWDPADGHNVRVELQASVSPNPGGITEYRVILTSI